ncbi:MULTISPECIES: glutamyl-tRNA reductase [unclassified Rothia (in: high G+C Gram-positive bacteria)]|uniref:glutamyl-tRNA reductase n=1 Tax=unclassified Rothia (in: high G+C Gram-positive bacteria) TaxID=2689056 RepID=UPI0019576B53|nr:MULTISPECIES: glutamyl-tRNA reductase [unclassified Rothia (in: high G+C Gram-positive bacteria)]MBM7051084.1 glutamyl-tRNA reductase [Rothia sp. ZJ1223]QRZ62216.1 glutamyl-tRNA reductase [Rothia sp. ZJ932]
MTIFTLVASHKTVDLETVAKLSTGAIDLPKNLKEEGFEGSVILSTCNRLELYVETSSQAAPAESHRAQQVEENKRVIISQLAQLSGIDTQVALDSFETYVDHDAAHHLFTVASGLESAVVGEREITGQVRRAIATAQEDGHATGNLVRLFNQGTQTARQVGQQTALGSRGRSIVSVALDLADDVAEKTWEDRTALVFGTGAYAGATMAALADRGCTRVLVFSRSHRAEEFAAKRGGIPVADGALEEAMAEADVIIGCSGGSAPITAHQIPAGKRVVLDLALTRDFDPSIAELEGVELITLESVRLAAPEETAESVEMARSIVAAASSEFTQKEKARDIDAAIVALRSHTLSILDTELEKVRTQFGCSGASEHLEFAMRRMVKSLLHSPTVRAKELAKEGRADEYIAGLEALYGIEVESSVTPAERDYKVS